jgi:thiol-disulfide isomerase/thioredoxin
MRHAGTSQRGPDWLRLFSLVGFVMIATVALIIMLGWPMLLPSSGAVGKPMPAVDLAPLTGDASSITLDDLDGKVALINFWATWCPPCRHELPDIAALQQAYAGDDRVRILPVTYESPPDPLDSLRKSTTTLLDQMDLELTTYADPDLRTQSAFSQVGSFRGFPTTVLLDGRGVIRTVWVGARGGDVFQAEIDRLVNEPEQ